MSFSPGTIARYSIRRTVYLGEESSAEDALQETLLNVYRGISNFRGDSKVSTWISRITINVCLGMLRKGKNKQCVELEDEFAGNMPAESTPYTDPLAYAALEEQRSLVRDAFRRMSEKQGVVVRLHDMEGYTIQEICKNHSLPGWNREIPPFLREAGVQVDLQLSFLRRLKRFFR